jgi:hypothetical protein
MSPAGSRLRTMILRVICALSECWLADPQAGLVTL